MSKRDPRFDDGEPARSDFRNTGRRVQPHKLAQLCTQIRRALELALLGNVQDDLLLDLEVDAVDPCADPGRLRVRYVFHGSADQALVSQRLEAARGILTAEVAQAISRKKVPELVFEIRAVGDPAD